MDIKLKYKDIRPQQTIQNIKLFFKTNGYKIKINTIQQPIQHIWWCRIELFYQNFMILRSHGKGTTKIFALASGYAELYERFCAEYDIFSNDPLFKFYKRQYNIKFYEKKDEIFLPIEQIIKNSTSCHLDLFIRSITDNQNNFINFLKLNYPKGMPCILFQSIDNKLNKYLPLDLIKIMTGSDGLAAGNSINEAIVQGSAELCEHYVYDQLYYNNKQKFYALNTNKLNLSIYLQNIINKLSKLYKIYIYDFSYTYFVPVVGLLLIDINTHLVYFNLGASPIFEIALERCFTEIFQQCKILNDQVKTTMIPLCSINIDDFLSENYFNISDNNAYPIELITNQQICDNFNSQIFLYSQKYDNQQLKDYFVKLFNNLQWHVYYANLSLTDKIITIKMYVDNLNTFQTANINILQNINISQKNKLWLFMYLQQKLILNYINNYQLNHTDFYNYFEIFKELLIDMPKFWNNFIIDKFCFNLNYTLLYNKNILSIFQILELMTSFQKLYTYYSKEKETNINTNIYLQLKIYFKILDYSKHNYTFNDIEKLIKLYNIHFSKKDFQNLNNFEYLFIKIILEPTVPIFLQIIKQIYNIKKEEKNND